LPRGWPMRWPRVSVRRFPDQWADFYREQLEREHAPTRDGYNALKLWRERWVFTPAELDAPGRCNREDVFIADPPDRFGRLEFGWGASQPRRGSV
jgi:hypothetical protein